MASPTFVQEQRRILEAIAVGTSTSEVLALITRMVEAEAPGLRASVLLLEGTKLLHGAAPSLPDAYNEAIHGIEIGPEVGSCGAAAFSGQKVVVEDVQSHPNWAPFRELAAAHGLRACWSAPIPGRHGEVVGTFAMYHGEPRGPTPAEAHLVTEATHLASIAIQHDRMMRAETHRLADERRRAEVRELLRHAPTPIAILVGPDFVYEFANPAYERISGRTGLEGRRLKDAFPEVEAQGVLQIVQSVYDTGTPFENPQMRIDLDRGHGTVEEAWFSVRIDPYVSPDGAVRGIFSVAVDITHEVRARNELDSRRSEIAIHEKTSALGQLVSGVAHEIRTPLTYLATNLNLIQMRLDRLRRDLPAHQADACAMLVDQYIPSALEGADRINHIVEDLRDFTQQRHDVREPAPLRLVVSQAVSLFQATHRGRVKVRLDSGKDAVIVVDKLQVQQAVLNLLQNAMEAGPRDHAIVVRTFADEGNAWIEVVDSGPGIPPAAQAKIFDPFYTTRQNGTGLGLSIVKRVADDHRAKVSFESSPQGTTFRLAFPLQGGQSKNP